MTYSSYFIIDVSMIKNIFWIFRLQAFVKHTMQIIALWIATFLPAFSKIYPIYSCLILLRYHMKTNSAMSVKQDIFNSDKQGFKFKG